MAAPQASSRLEMLQARFQQKQLQEKEQKLLQLYDQQQQRAYQVVQRGSAGSNSSNHGSSVTHQTVTRTSSTSHTTSTSQGGKVRQMFDERRQTTVKGIDRSYPLEPLENKPRTQTNGNGVTVPSQKNGNLTVNRQSMIVKRVGRADVNSNLNGGKPIVSYHEEITRESFGPQLRQQEQDDEDENEFGNENYVTRHANGNIRHDNHHQILDQETIDNNRMMAKLHLMEFDETMKHRIRNDLESEEFPDELMVDVPDKLPKRTVTKKLSQAEARLERFKNMNARRSNVSKNTTPTTTVTKKRSEPMNSVKSTPRMSEVSKMRTAARERHVRKLQEAKRVRGNSGKYLRGLFSSSFQGNLQKTQGENSELENSIMNEGLDAVLIKSGRHRPEIKSGERKKGDEGFFCVETDKSATTFSLKPKSVVETAAYSRRNRGNRIESLKEGSGKTPEIAKTRRRNSALTRSDSARSNKREKSAATFSLKPSYGRATSSHYVTTDTFKNTSAKLFSGDSKKDTGRNDDNPDFFCVESEKSATTFRLSPSKPKDDTKSSEIVKQGSTGFTDVVEINPRTSTTTTLNSTRSNRRNSSSDERESTSPEFFCVESEKSATTFSWKPETDNAPHRGKDTVKNGDKATKVSEAELRKLDIIRRIKESGEPTAGTSAESAKQKSYSSQFHRVKSEKSPTSFSLEGKSSGVASLRVKKPEVRNSAQVAESFGKNASIALHAQVHGKCDRGKNYTSPFSCGESKTSSSNFALNPENRTPSPYYGKSSASDRSSPEFSGRRSRRLSVSEKMGKTTRRPFTPDSLKSNKSGSSSPEFFCIESDRSATTYKWRPETIKTPARTYTSEATKSRKLSELFKKTSEKSLDSLNFNGRDDGAASPDTFRKLTKTPAKNPQFYLHEKDSVVVKDDKAKSKKTDSAHSTRRIFEKSGTSPKSKNEPAKDSSDGSITSKNLRQIGERKIRERGQGTNKESPSARFPSDRKLSRSPENLLRSIGVVRDIIKRQRNDKHIRPEELVKEKKGPAFADTGKGTHTKESEMINRTKREKAKETDVVKATGRSITPSDRSYKLSTTDSSPKSCVSITEVDTEVHEITIPDQFVERGRIEARKPDSIKSKIQTGKTCSKIAIGRRWESVGVKESGLSERSMDNGKEGKPHKRGTIILKKADIGKTYSNSPRAPDIGLKNREKTGNINPLVRIIQKAPKKRGSLLESNIFVPMCEERAIKETNTPLHPGQSKQNKDEDLRRKKDQSRDVTLRKTAHRATSVEKGFRSSSSSPTDATSLLDSKRRPSNSSASRERVITEDLLRSREQGSCSFGGKEKMTESGEISLRGASKSYRRTNPTGGTLTSRGWMRPGKESSSETDGRQVLRSVELVRRAMEKKAGTREESTQSSGKKVSSPDKGIGSATPREKRENVNQGENNADLEAAGKYDTADSCRFRREGYIKTIKRTEEDPRTNKSKARGAKNEGIKNSSIAKAKVPADKEKNVSPARMSEPRRFRNPSLNNVKDSPLSNKTGTRERPKGSENIKRATCDSLWQKDAKEAPTHKNESSVENNFKTESQSMKNKNTGGSGTYDGETRKLLEKQEVVYSSSEETVERKTVETDRYEMISERKTSFSKYTTETLSGLSPDACASSEKLMKYDREKGSNNKCGEEIFGKSVGMESEGAKSRIISVNEYERTDSVESALKRFDSIGRETEYRETTKTRVTESSSVESSPKTATRPQRETEKNFSYESTTKKKDSLNDRIEKSDVAPVSLKALDEKPRRAFSENYESTKRCKDPLRGARILRITETPNSRRESKRISRIHEIRSRKRIASARDSMEIARAAMKSNSPTCKRRLFQNSDFDASFEEAHKLERTENLSSLKRNKTESTRLVESFSSFSSYHTANGKAVKAAGVTDKVVTDKNPTKKSTPSSLPPVRQLRSIEDIRKSIRKTGSDCDDTRASVTTPNEPMSKSAIANDAPKRKDNFEAEKQRRGKLASEFRSLSDDSRITREPGDSSFNGVTRLSRIAKSPSPDPAAKRTTEASNRPARRSVPPSPSNSPDAAPRRASSDMKTQETKASRRSLPTKTSEIPSKKTTINRKSTDAIDGDVQENGPHSREQIVGTKQDNSTSPKKADVFVIEFEDGNSKEGDVVPPKKPLLRKQSSEKQSSPTHSTRPVSSISSVSSGSSAQGQTSGPRGKMGTRAKTPISGTPSSKVSASGRSAGSASTAENLAPCSVCGRRFAQERIGLHEQICVKTGQKKRKQFDTVMYRVRGTDLEPFVKKGIAKKQPESKPKKPEVKSNWRRKHEDFINAIRSAKQVQAHLAAGGKLSDLPPPPASDTSDYIQCPHCGRKFNQAAAERHIPKCEHMLHNKPVHSRTQKPRR